MSKFDEFMRQAMDEWQVERLRLASEVEVLQGEADEATAEVQAVLLKIAGVEDPQVEATELRQSLLTAEATYKAQMSREFSAQWRLELRMMEESMASSVGTSEAQEQVQAGYEEIAQQKARLQEEARVTEEAIHQREEATNQEMIDFEEFEAKRTAEFEAGQKEARLRFEEEKAIAVSRIAKQKEEMQAAEDNNGRSTARKKHRDAQAREGVERLIAAGIGLSDDEQMEPNAAPQASSWQASPAPLPMSRMTAVAASAAAAAGTAGRAVASSIRSSAGLASGDEAAIEPGNGTSTSAQVGAFDIMMSH